MRFSEKEEHCALEGMLSNSAQKAATAEAFLLKTIVAEARAVASILGMSPRKILFLQVSRGSLVSHERPGFRSDGRNNVLFRTRTRVPSQKARKQRKLWKLQLRKGKDFHESEVCGVVGLQ